MWLGKFMASRLPAGIVRSSHASLLVFCERITSIANPAYEGQRDSVECQYI